MAKKYLIVGLGNPGRKYAKNRHNIGFHVADVLINRYHLPQSTTERKALTTDGTIQNQRVIIAKPQTYMNLSGESVRALSDYYNIPPEQIIVAYDELDLPLGTLRLRSTGGHGGHNGIRNTIKHLGTKEFARVRVGIGRPPGRMQVKDYVLQDFTGDEAILAEQVIEAAADAIETWLTDGIDVAMSRYNGDIMDSGTAADPDPTELLKVAERAHELNPNDPDPVKTLIKLYKQLQRMNDAVRAHLELGEIYRRDDNLKGMINEYERAAKMRPELVDVREEIAQAYENIDNERKATQTWFKLATYHRDNDNPREALGALEQVLRLNPQHTKALQLQEQLRNDITM